MFSASCYVLAGRAVSICLALSAALPAAVTARRRDSPVGGGRGTWIVRGLLDSGARGVSEWGEAAIAEVTGLMCWNVLAASCPGCSAVGDAQTHRFLAADDLQYSAPRDHLSDLS